jgi:TRAP-type uncharacterized transport system fused permease subunit
MSQADRNQPAPHDAGPMIAAGTDEEPLATNQRDLRGRLNYWVVGLCIAYTAFHVAVMNLYPLETWTYRMIHLAGGLFIGFVVYSAVTLKPADEVAVGKRSVAELGLMVVALAGAGYGLAMIAFAWGGLWFAGLRAPAPFVFQTFGIPLLIATVAAVAGGWFFPDRSKARVHWGDWALAAISIAVLGYILFNVGPLRLRAGTAMAQPADFYAALVGVILILELTRRVAGLALVVIAGLFIAYSFLGPYLPGFLNHRGYNAGALSSPTSSRTGHPRRADRGLLDLHHPLHHLRRLPPGLSRRRLLS